MLRSVYTALLYVFAPIALAATALRGLRDPAYRDRLSERLGFTRVFQPSSGNRPLWIHAVSVGEVQAAAPLIRTPAEEIPAAFAVDHDRDAYRCAACAGIVRRFRASCLLALRPAGRGASFPGSRAASRWPS